MGNQEERILFLSRRLLPIGHATPVLLCAAALVLGWGCAASSEMGPVGAGTGGASAGSGGSGPSGGSGGVSGSGGAVAGSGGAMAGSGGAGLTDGPPVVTTDGGGPDTSTGGGSDASLPPLQECPKPSIDRIQYFGASGEGTTVPMSGTLLVKEGTRYVAKQQFLRSEWHVMEVLIGNTFNAQVDLSNDKGFTLTWSATADLWIQMRPGFHYSGGAQWVTKVPSTGGQVKTQYFPLDPASWTTISLGKPTWPYAMARAAVRGFVFVGDMPNVITISGLRFDSYVPMCM